MSRSALFLCKEAARLPLVVTSQRQSINIFCYQFHISDFRRKTAHLTHEQKGIYRDILDAYYFSGGNLPSDISQLSRIISVHTQSERDALIYAVSMYFKFENGRLKQRRADEEIAKIADKSAEARASANSKHVRHKDSESSERSANAQANAVLTNNQEPITIVKEHTHAPLTAIPADWNPTVDHENRCRALGYNPITMAAAFRSNHKANGRNFADWDAAFDLWIGNEKNF